MVYCDCGSEMVFGIFEVIVLISIFIGFYWMSCSACGQLKTVYLARHERLQERKKKKMNNSKRLLRRELESDVEAAQGSGRARRQSTSPIDTDLS